MCGIIGFWNVAANISEARVSSILDGMRHRGPDGKGTLSYPGGAAGMVRLALVDLSDRGQQPLWSADGRVAILFNGEIYNFRSERSRLEAAGYRFQTTTDTEVILNLYLEHGLKFLERLRGMFAIALFDWRKTGDDGMPEVILARDRLGVKHLYLAHPGGDPTRVIFASEVQAILASGFVDPTIDRQSLAGYLAYGFVPQPGTLISGVRMLEPGTLEHYAPGKPVVRQRWWRMPAYEPRAESLDEAARRLRTILEESVALHAKADAPIGAFLSGGVDSTGVVALMRPHISDLRTYTLRFPDLDADDEVREAAETAKLFDCQHTVADVTSREIAELLPRYAGEMDQPSSDGLNIWLISRAAARDVKGVLSGLGGDEWFAGYPVTRRMVRYSSPLHAAAGSAAYWLSPLMPGGSLRRRVETFAARRDPITTWLQAHSVFPAQAASRMAGLEEPISQRRQLIEILGQDELDWQKETPLGLSCLLDTRIYMRHQLLRDADAASMAHSLELRVPFVSARLAEYSRTCADEYKLRPDGGNGNRYEASGSKRVLIHALGDLLPRSIANRPKKGFTLPFRRWLEGSLKPLVEDTCGDATVRRRGLLDPKAVAQARSTASRLAPYPNLWSLMILELWCRAVLDTPRPSNLLAAASAGQSE